MPSLILINGEEDFLMERTARDEVSTSLIEDLSEFTLPDGLESYLYESQVPTIFDSPRVFILWEVTDIPPLPLGKSDLLICVAKSPKKPLEDKRAKRVHNYPKLKCFDDNNEIVGWILREGNSLNIDLSRVATALFVNSGKSLRKISSEITKISVICPKGTVVSPDDVRGIICFSAELNPQQVMEGICDGQTAKAIAYHDRLQEANEETGWIIAFLQRHVIQQLKVEVLKRDGVSEKEIPTILDIHPFVFKKSILPRLGLWTIEYLKDSLNRLCDLDIAHKSGDDSSKFGLEMEIIKMSEEAKKKISRKKLSSRTTDQTSIYLMVLIMSNESVSASSDVTSTMCVKKRNGSMEAVNVNKIVQAVDRCCHNLRGVDAFRVATKTIGGLFDGATTEELDKLSIQTAASLVVEDPDYARLAARLLSTTIEKEVRNQEIQSFSQSIARAHELNIVNDDLMKFVKKNARKLNDALDVSRNDNFEYFGLRTVYDRYLLKHPETRLVLETPQHFFLRIACALSTSVQEALELYNLFSSLSYLPSSPTLFNSGTRHQQLSSCFLLDSPQDDLESIYRKYTDIALLSKFSGGIGLAYHRIRARGSLIASTNGHSNGIIPWLKTLDASVCAVNQAGKRKGACCVYLESWHADIEDFLELRDNTGDEAARTHNLNVANWISDIFMRRVEADEEWSLFDPKAVPDLPDLFGPAFEQAYLNYEAQGLAMRKVKARDLYGKMMRTLAQTGNGWITFKDKSNLACNQTALPGHTVHLSNLCTEIIEITSEEESAVCNLGSINLSRHTKKADDGSVTFDFDKLASTVKAAIRQLDFVIDKNLYQIPSAKASNMRWRPVGLGFMGLQDVFFQMRIAFDSPEARAISKSISEEIYFHALTASCDLAEAKGQHKAFPETRAARGELQFDAWGVVPSDTTRWDALRERIKKTGLRNSLLIAIAPTATIASIVGCYECIEPQVSNLFKRETLSGDFLQINRYLVDDLKDLGLWDDEMKSKLKMSEGSVAGMSELPEDVRTRFRTVWEIPMRSLIDMAADRGAFIDQSQSLNLFIESPNIGQLSSMYFYAWKKGLKTTYYLRSRPATRITKATVENKPVIKKEVDDAEAVSCSLENPEACEACQLEHPEKRTGSVPVRFF